MKKKKKRKPFHGIDGKPINISKLNLTPGSITYMDPPGILTAEQLSARWGGQVLPGTLENWRSAGLGPRYVKFGKGRNCKVVYRLSAVEEYERANEMTPKPA